MALTATQRRTNPFVSDLSCGERQAEIIAETIRALHPTNKAFRLWATWARGQGVAGPGLVRAHREQGGDYSLLIAQVIDAQAKLEPCPQQREIAEKNAQLWRDLGSIRERVTG